MDNESEDREPENKIWSIKLGKTDIQVGGQREAAFTFHCCFCGKATICGFVCFAGEAINAKTIGSMDGIYQVRLEFVEINVQCSVEPGESAGEMEIGRIRHLECFVML